MKKYYQKGLYKVCCFLSMMVLMLGVQVTAVAQTQVNSAANGKVVAAKNITALDGRQVLLSVSGQMPSKAKVQATPVQRTSPNGKQVFGAYDITIQNGNAEWQPQAGQPVMVSISDPNFTDGQMMDVYHEGANGNEFVATVAAQNGTITFPAKSFSVYIVTETGDEARLKVNFYQNSNQVTNSSPVVIYVKKTDLTGGYFNSIVYDPGAGNLPSGVAFFGWVKEKPNYTIADTASTTALTIANIRTEVQGILSDEANPVQEGDEINYYALLFKTYIVSYYDGTPATIGSDNIYFRADATQTQYTYTISKTYVPTSSEYNFMGWVVKGEVDESTGTIIYPTAGNIVNPQSDGLYQLGDQITIQGNVNFSVDEEQGHWLVFDENGKGATYNAPQFVKNGDVTSDEDLLPMTRPGYEFSGWYTDPECTTGFEFGGELTDRTIIYAKWEAHTNADYSVIVWKQKLTEQTDPNNANADYDFGRSFRIENGSVGTHPNVVVGTPGDPSITINGTTVYDTGFHYARTDQSTVTITPEGTTVVNVYLDRDEITLNFYTYYTYTETTSNTGTQYGLVNGRHVELTRNGNTYTATYSGTRYTRSGSAGNYTYTATTSNNGTQYGLVNGEYVELTRSGYFNYTWTFTYTGTRYTRSGNSWTLYKSFTGRYGSTLAQNNKTWPAEYDWRSSGGNNGSTSGTRTTFLDAFLPASTASTVNFYGSEPEGDATAYFYKQNPDGSGYTLANTVSVSSGSTFYLSDKYNGFKCKAWNTSNNTSTWTLVGNTYNDGSNIYYDANASQNGNQSITLGNQLHVYFDVLKYNMTFASGSTYTGNNETNPETGAPTYGTHEELLSPEELHTESNVAYGLSIANLASYVPNDNTWPEGYVFDGWYADDNCTTPYTFSTMPANNVMLYAKWRQIRFRVFLHPNALLEETNERDETLDWGSESQKMCFAVAWGDKVSVPTGRRFGFEFIGWFTDPEFQHPFDKDAIVMNNTNVPATPAYDKTVDMTDDMDKWGLITNLGNGAYNSDVNRPWVQRKLDLYAQWRITVEGALGIDLVYDANGGTNAPEDPNHYLDAAKACAAAAATAPSNKVFSHWVLQHYNCNTNAFEDTDIELYPGSTFIVHRSDARIIVSQWCDPEDRTQIFTIDEPTPCNNTTPPTDTYTYVDPETGDQEARGYTKIYNAEYTIKLRAEYLDVEQPMPTFIIWYNNYTATGVDPILRQDGNTGQEGDTHEELIVNYAVSIPTPAARPGYTFKGWSKYNVQSTSNVPTTHETGENDPNFLIYVPGENGAAGYYTSVNGVPATEVAADEENPYDYLYAVWEANGYTVHFNNNGADGTETMEDQLFEFDQEQALTTNAFTYTDHCFQGWATTASSTTVAYTDGESVSNLTQTPGAVVNLYAVWKEKVTPVFDDILQTEYCLNAEASSLPTSSKEVSTEDATIPVVNGTWTDVTGATVNSVSTATAGTVTLTFVPEEDACAKPVEVEFTVNPLPTVNLTVPTDAQVLCPNKDTYPVSAEATGGTAPYSYAWTGATPTTENGPVANVTQEDGNDNCTPNGTNYTVSVVATDDNGCASAEAEKSFTVQMASGGITINEDGLDNPVTVDCPALADVPPTAFPVATDACGNTLENPTLKSVSEIPACAGENGSVVTYTYTYTDCAGNSADWEFTYNISAPAAPTLELNAATATPANDEEHPCAYVIPEITFEATAACDGDITSSTQNPEAGTFVAQTNEEQTIEITVSVEDGCGASATETTTVTIPAKPTVTITPSSTTACYGSNVQLSVPDNFVSYLWSNGLSSATITAEYLTETTTFTVTVTDANGCTATDTKEVTVGEIGTVEITGADAVCENGDVTLTAPAGNGNTYMWSTDETTQSITVSKMTATTKFYVTVTDASGCVSEGEKEVVVNTLPDVTIDKEESVAICDGETVTLTASGASTYVWNDDDETEGMTLTVDAEGTYTVTGTDGNGCKNTATVEVTVNELPNVTVNAENIAICDGETATVTASGAETYVWNDEDETEGATLTVSEAGTYKVTGTDANGCTAEATATVTVNPLPVVTLNSNSPVCSGETVTVTASSTTATSYSWNNGDWAAANQQTYTASQQNISVKGKDAKGCVSEAVTTSVTVNPLPNVTASANPATIYYGGTSELSATGASTYSWNVTNTTVSPEQTTTYTVTGTDANGCENTATVTVTVQNAQVTFNLDTTKVYDGTEFVVTTADLQSHITGLLDGHVLASGTITSEDYVYGNYTCAEGSSFAPVEGVAVKSGFRIDDQSGNDVTAHYTPAFHVTLHITQQPLTVTAASDSKLYDGTPLTNDQYTVTGLVDGDALVAQVTGSQTEVGTSNNLVGTVTITRGNRDVTESYEITKVNGTLTITSVDCQGVTYQDYYYPAVQIGTQCWLAENLRNTVYGPEETTAIADFAAYNNDEANMEKFGYLYTWYSAVGVEENNNAAVPETLEGTSLVQGICPEGWVVPSQTDFDILYQFTANEARRLRDMNPMYWIPGEQGVEPNYHFNSRAGGFYNSTSGQFERILLEDYYWTSTSDPNTTEVTTPMNAYYCNSINFKTSKKSDKRSVRCISQQTAYGAPTEPEEGEGNGE